MTRQDLWKYRLCFVHIKCLIVISSYYMISYFNPRIQQVIQRKTGRGHELDSGHHDLKCRWSRSSYVWLRPAALFCVLESYQQQLMSLQASGIIAELCQQVPVTQLWRLSDRTGSGAKMKELCHRSRDFLATAAIPVLQPFVHLTTLSHG